MSEENKAAHSGFLCTEASLQNPIVLDADGLNLLAAHPSGKLYLNDRTILTPHMREMSRLTKKSIEEIKKHPVSTALSCAAEQTPSVFSGDACTGVTADGRSPVSESLRKCGNGLGGKRRRSLRNTSRDILQVSFCKEERQILKKSGFKEFFCTRWPVILRLKAGRAGHDRQGYHKSPCRTWMEKGEKIMKKHSRVKAVVSLDAIAHQFFRKCVKIFRKIQK